MPLEGGHCVAGAVLAALVLYRIDISAIMRT